MNHEDAREGMAVRDTETGELVVILRVYSRKLWVEYIDTGDRALRRADEIEEV